MSVELDNIEIKPLAANLLRINIGKYLQTSDYSHLVIEKNFDKIWKAAQQEVSDRSSVIILGFDNSGDYEDAILLVLDSLWETSKADFFSYLYITIKDFIRWDRGKTDLTRVFESLEQLKMAKQQLDELRTLTKQKIKPDSSLTPEKQPELKQTEIKIDEKLCFVLMPFNDKLNPIYESIIKPVFKDLKLSCKRADEIFISKPIIEDIWDNIRKAKFLIADLTDRNANVFYELGLAHAINKDVILLTQDLNDVPFDLRHFRILVYQDSISGAEKLKSTLKDFINELVMKKK